MLSHSFLLTTCPLEFKGNKARERFLTRKYLSKLKDKEPFLLVTQYVREHLTCTSATRGRSDDFVETAAYFGISTGLRPFGFDKEGNGLVVSAKPHVIFRDRFSGKSTALQDSDIRISLFSFLRTPLTKEFDVPLPGIGPSTKRRVMTNHRGRAFCVAVGGKAIEEFCLSDWGSIESLDAAYVAAAQKLGWPIITEPMRTFRVTLRERLLGYLFAARKDERKRLLDQIADYGFDHDTDVIRLGGYRYRINEFVEDIRAL